MNTIADVLLNFIDWNQGINYSKVALIIFGYFGLFWFAISFWVIRDASQRGVNKFLAVFIGLANFFLFVPFLIVYLLLRPHFTEDFDEWHEGGVNMPIVNFTGEQGIEMSFEMRIHPKKLAKVNNTDMKIDISFDSQDPKKQLMSPVVVNLNSENEKVKIKKEKKKINFYRFGIRTKIRKLFREIWVTLKYLKPKKKIKVEEPKNNLKNTNVEKNISDQIKTDLVDEEKKITKDVVGEILTEKANKINNVFDKKKEENKIEPEIKIEENLKKEEIKVENKIEVKDDNSKDIIKENIVEKLEEKNPLATIKSDK
ncbi:MAG: hypothetical protein WCJ58_02320 [bacterium]